MGDTYQGPTPGEHAADCSCCAEQRGREAERASIAAMADRLAGRAVDRRIEAAARANDEADDV